MLLFLFFSFRLCIRCLRLYCEADKPGSGAKMSPQMFVSQFLKLHGLLHTADRLRQAVKISCVLAESLTSLIVSDALSTWQLLQVTNINMWAHHQLPALRISMATPDSE